MDLIIAYDSTESIIAGTKGTVNNIYIGILLTVLILLLFLGDPRVTIVAAVVIPASLISAFFPMDFSRFSINMMTLLAIATALGTLIANALVVIESIDQHLAHGKASVQAAIDGTKDAFVAVLASAGTNIVVFTPIAFMGGMVGQFMKHFGLTVVYATIFSIIASLSLTPMLCALLLQPRNLKGKSTERNNIFKKFFTLPHILLAILLAEYKIVFNKIFKYPKLTMLFSLLLVIGSYYPLHYLGNEFFAASD
ncbi:MAG: efflux RND transporter permease subunit, partial [bacterium]